MLPSLLKTMLLVDSTPLSTITTLPAELSLYQGEMQQSVPKPKNVIKLSTSVICEDKVREDEYYLDVNQGFSVFRVPGVSDPTDNSTHTVCLRNLQPTMQVDICEYDTSNISDIQSFTYSDYAISQSCVHTFVNLDTQAAGIPLITFPSVRDNYTPAFTFGIIFAAVAIIWLVIMYVSYQRNAKLYQEFETSLEEEMKTSAYAKLRSEILSHLVDKSKLSETDPRVKEKMSMFAGGFEKVSKVAEEVGKINLEAQNVEFFVNEDFYGRPAQTRIEKLGQSGFSLKMSAFLWPWRLCKIGNSTLLIRRNDQLFLLPKIFTLKVAYRISIQIFTILVLAVAYIIYHTVPSIYRPDTFGYFWMIGGFFFAILIIHLDMSAPQEKGMLKLLRSIGEPKIPEIMFSYNWGFQKESIRTLAHSMWNSGIGVWIDYIKLISGDKLPQDIRRAANEVNLVVVFLTPLYLSSGNCCIEFEEAIKQPGKLHVHVLKWDDTVREALRFLINDVKLPLSHVTSHPDANSMSKEAPFVYEDSDTDRYIQKLEKQGLGWRELTGILHNYSKKDGDSWDFSWWLMNTQTGGGIPESAPCPRKVQKWNLRPFYPLTKLPTIYDITHSRGAVKVGNVYLSEDCRKSGNDGSALPWRMFLFVLVALFPLLDVIRFNNLEKTLYQFTDECVEYGKSVDNDPRIRGAICDKFYEGPVYRGNISNPLAESAFRVEYVNQAFAKWAKSTGCAGVRKPANPIAVEDALECVTTLYTWFKDYGYIGNRMVWAVMFILSTLFLITITVNFDRIVDTTGHIPACLRPLLAVSNLKRRKSASTKTNPTEIARGLDTTSEIQIDILPNSKPVQLERGIQSRAVVASNIQDRLPPIPTVCVKVHGRGLIADNLRTFLSNLDRLLPDHVVCPDVFEANPVSIGTVLNAARIGDEGYAWVNVFVITSQLDLQMFYQLNRDGKVDLEVSVVVVDHQPVPGIVKFSDFKNMDDNILKISEAALWLFTVVFIETRMRDQLLGLLHDYPTPELADQIMVNISLRTKDALFSYGHVFLRALLNN
ncbi:hypothetical protein HK098_006403 [Nowakowskiella sp. JEL0407]|nr:hypothetical protein HK098_006403 [Nowakowskiella sp. JEL0407]